MPHVPFLPQFLVMLAVTAAAHFGPHVSRPDMLFGVTVAPQFRRADAARGIVSQFRLGVWSCLLLALIVGFVLDRPLLAGVLYLGGMFVAFVTAHRAAGRHASAPARVVEVDLTAPPENLPGGPVLAGVPLVLLSGLAVFAWITKTSVPSVITLLAVPATFCVLLIVIALAILHRSRRIHTAGQAGARERLFRRRIVLLILFTEYVLVFPPAFKLFQLPWPATEMWVVAVLLVMAFFIAILMRDGQGGVARTRPDVTIGDRTPDACWKFGLFYFNPADAALFVEKRMGVGYTLNFGNVWSWILLATLLAVPVILRFVVPR